MTRLIGDADKAECKVDKLRSITSKLDEKEIEVEAEIFKAMADPCRLKILSLLREGELCVCEIMVGVDRPQSSTSHHLSILKDAGLIKERKDGRWSRYRLSEGAVIEMLNLVKLMKEAKVLREATINDEIQYICKLQRVLRSGNSDAFLDSFCSCGGRRLQLQWGQLGSQWFPEL